MKKLSAIAYFFITLFVSVQSFSLKAQETKPITYSGSEPVLSKASQMPEFNGGEEKLFQFIAMNIKYPAKAREKNISGKVFVNFVIDKDGKVRDAKILRGIGGGCDEEVLRVMSIMPDWIPGKEDGKPVNVSYNLPVNFSLKDAEKNKN